MGSVSLLYKTITIIVFLITGSLSAVLINIAYSLQTKGYHNISKKFQRPWFQVWCMFLGMLPLIFNTHVIKTLKCLPYKIGGKRQGWGLFRITSIAAIFDLLCTILQFIAYKNLTPSIWQMLRGSILIFTALLSKFYRKKSLTITQWIGVIVIIIGITIVGLSYVLNQEKNNSINDYSKSKELKMDILAVFLVFIAQGLTAFKVIIEEEFLHDDDASSSEIVSYEGIWGIFLVTFIIMPIANIMPENALTGIYENTIESVYMISHSWEILVTEIFYVVTIIGFNQSGMLITQFSNAINRNIWEILKSIGVWIVSLFVYYVLKMREGGEKLTLMSLLQLFGFAICILGALVYNDTIKFPCVSDFLPVSDKSMPSKVSLLN